MVDPTVGTAIISTAGRLGLTKVLSDAIHKGRYRVLSTVRAKLYMEEARKDAIAGLQENLKSEVKVWAGLGWEADKCPLVALGKGEITEQVDVEALAAASISIDNQAILDIGSEELRGRKGFSFIVMFKVPDTPVLTRSEDAVRFLRENFRDIISYLIQKEQKPQLDALKPKSFATDLTYLRQEALVANEVAEAVMSISADRQYKLEQSTGIISGDQKEAEADVQKRNTLEMFWKDVGAKADARLQELEFEERMKPWSMSLQPVRGPLAEAPKRGDALSPLQKRDKSLSSGSGDRPLISALANIASEQGIKVTHEGISRVIQSEVAVTEGELLGPVILYAAKQDAAWQFNGTLSKSDMETLNTVSRGYIHGAKCKWTGSDDPMRENHAVSIVCAVAACLSSSFLLTYEDRTDLKKFVRRHLVIGSSGSIEALAETRTSGSVVHLNMRDDARNLRLDPMETKEDILAEIDSEGSESTMGYGLTRSWCSISTVVANGRIGLDKIFRFLNKARRRDLVAFLKAMSSGKLSRVQREESVKQLYLDVQARVRSTHCHWLDDLLRKWAAGKRSTRIRVALMLKREEVASALELEVEAKAPETDLKILTRRMQELKVLLTEKVRKMKFIGERGNIVALQNSFKEREFSTFNRFRRYVNNKFVVHVSGKNVIVVEKRGDSRMATWLPCQPKGYEAKYTPNRIGELSDKAALAFVVFGRRQGFLDDVEYDDLIHAENGEANLERALTQVVKQGTELFEGSAQLARKVIEIGNEVIALTRNDNDMVRRFIMVTAYAEGVGIVDEEAEWIKIVPDVKPRSGGATFKIDYKMPSVMLYGDGEWVVVGNSAYQTRPATGGIGTGGRMLISSGEMLASMLGFLGLRNQSFVRNERQQEQVDSCKKGTAQDSASGIQSDADMADVANESTDRTGMMNNERVLDISSVKDAGLLRESLWPGGLVLC